MTVDQEAIGHFGVWTLVLSVCGDLEASVWGPWKHTGSRVWHFCLSETAEYGGKPHH